MDLGSSTGQSNKAYGHVQARKYWNKGFGSGQAKIWILLWLKFCGILLNSLVISENPQMCLNDNEKENVESEHLWDHEQINAETLNNSRFQKGTLTTKMYYVLYK